MLQLFFCGVIYDHRLIVSTSKPAVMLLSRALGQLSRRSGRFLPPQVLSQRCFAEKISKQRPDSIVDEEMRKSTPRYPALFVGCALVAGMFCWAPFLFGGVVIGSIAEGSTTEGKAVGGQSERGDEVRERMKREFAERKSKEKEEKNAKA